MAITGFFRKTVTTQRPAAVGGASKRQEWAENLTGVACAIHPLNAELVAVQGGAFYNMFKMFCGKSLDIQIGDRIIDGSDTYTVSGKSLYDDMGGRNNEHMRLVLVKGK